uniref:Mitochondrial ribosomal protein S24 n=1 Tax=Lates calcarifer TaxID=8187 RepID=A0A4W6ET70_LATCA
SVTNSECTCGGGFCFQIEAHHSRQFTRLKAFRYFTLFCSFFFPRLQNRAARIRVGKGDKPVTYEQAFHPHHIAHRKGWLSLHTSNLKGEDGAADRTVEDTFIRRFMFGTFHGCLANELVLKRRGNLLVICAIMVQKIHPQKFYFLIGYTETMLSYFYKCPVKIEIQTVPEKVVYKYI